MTMWSPRILLPLNLPLKLPPSLVLNLHPSTPRHLPKLQPNLLQSMCNCSACDTSGVLGFILSPCNTLSLNQPMT